MKVLLTILVAALAAFGARRLALARATPEPRADTEPAVAELLAGVQELRRENERLTQELARRAELVVAAPAPAAEIGEAEIGEAEIGASLARWRAGRPADEEAQATGTDNAPRARRVQPEPGDELDIATIPMSELVQALANEGLGNFERQELFQRLREAGRIDEYVAAIEKLAAEDPDDVDLQVALGHAYLQKLFGVGNSPEAGPLAFKSDAAFDRALALDDQNWSARFSKAVSLSNWPAFMGRGPEAIEHFEILLEQQEQLPKRPEFAMTYLFLGNMHQAGGAREAAIATWKEGLALFPEIEDLQRALELAQANAQGGEAPATTRPARR